MKAHPGASCSALPGPWPIPAGSAKKFVPLFLMSPCYVLKSCNEVSPEPSLQAKPPQLSAFPHVFFLC